MRFSLTAVSGLNAPLGHQASVLRLLKGSKINGSYLDRKRSQEEVTCAMHKCGALS